MALLGLATAALTLFASFPTDVGGQMLFLLHRKDASLAFEKYLEHAAESGEHDFALLQQAGMRLLEQGIDSDDPETQLMCMFGAGVANTPDLLHILEKGIHTKEPRIQLTALNYLGKQNDDFADELVLEALSSPFLATRLEGCYQLAQKNHPSVLSHLQSLVVKVPDLVRALFPQIVVHLDGSNANQYLKQLLTDSNLDVRMEAILAVAKLRRDDFLPQIRKLASQVHFAQQECCALALGELKDTQSIPLLKNLRANPHKEVQLAAAIALYEMGEGELAFIENLARSEDLFAIAALGKLQEGKGVLRELIHHTDRDVRLNAILSLLQQGEAGPVEEILLPGNKDLGFMRTSSPGHGLQAWKTIPSHHHNTKGYSGLVGQTMGLRENVLIQCLELPEAQFLKIARHLITQRRTELIPLLVELLENKRSDAATALLKIGHQTAGDPFIRNYCTLALYRMREEGPYEQQLINWVKSAGDQVMIQFREDDGEPSLSTRHELTPEESSRFLVETFQTLAQAQNKAGIEALIHAMAYGNPKNRYALAGLLIRTTE